MLTYCYITASDVTNVTNSGTETNLASDTEKALDTDEDEPIPTKLSKSRDADQFFELSKKLSNGIVCWACIICR